MTELLSDTGYELAKSKRDRMIERLESLEKNKSELSPLMYDEVRLSNLDMIRQYSREIKYYEAHHGISADKNDQSLSSVTVDV